MPHKTFIFDIHLKIILDLIDLLVGWWLVGWLDGWMDGWIHVVGRMGGQTDRQIDGFDWT